MIQITDIPSDYPICEKADCPKAAHCLHQIAYAPLRKREPILKLINLDFCKPGDSCSFYRSSEPVRYAYGFAHFQEEMLPRQYDCFCTILRSHYGRTAFYDRRRGDKPLSPKEQELVWQAARKAGVTRKLQFSRYEERIDWSY